MWPPLTTIAIVFRRMPTKAMREARLAAVDPERRRGGSRTPREERQPQRVDERRCPRSRRYSVPKRTMTARSSSADPAQPDRREVAERAAREQAEDEARERCRRSARASGHGRTQPVRGHRRRIDACRQACAIGSAARAGGRAAGRRTARERCASRTGRPGRSALVGDRGRAGRRRDPRCSPGPSGRRPGRSAGSGAAPSRRPGSGTPSTCGVRTKASTTTGSNWMPANLRSSPRACSGGERRHPVGPGGRHRLEGVGDVEDPGELRDLVADQAVRVARSRCTTRGGGG